MSSREPKLAEAPGGAPDVPSGPRHRTCERRWWHRAVTAAAATGVAGVLVLLLARGAWAATPAAPASPTDPPGCTNLWDSVSPNCLVKRASGAIASGIAGKIVDAVSWLAKQIGDGARTAGRPDVAQGWFDWAMFNTRQLGVLFAVVGMLLSICYAALKRDLGEIGRTLARVLAAGLTTGGITMVVAAANNLVDNLCDYVLGRRGWAVVTDAVKLPVQHYARMAASTAPGISAATPEIITVLIGLLMLLALAMIWVELLIRRIVIDVCVLFWPLAVSGAVWANARLWTRRLVDTITGFVLSKLLIIILLRFAADALTDMNSASDLLVAVGVFALAALMPFWVMRVIGFFGGAIQPGHTGEGLRAAATGAAVAAGMTVARAATSVAGAGATAGATSGAGSAAGLAGAGAGKGGAGVLGGGRTPMPPVKRPGQGSLAERGQWGGQGHRGGQGVRRGPANEPRRTGPAPGGRPAFPPTGAPPQQGEGGTDPANAPNDDGEQTPPAPSPVPHPPAPRRYPRTPVPPHVRPAPSGSGPGGSGSGEQSSAGGGTPGTSGPPPGPGAAPRPAARPAQRPAPWPQPRRGDPSEPMLRPQPPPAPPPEPPAASPGEGG